MNNSFQDYLEDNKMFNFEGSGGLRNLTKICQELGYKESGFKFGSPIEEFLSDNPGAIEAILEFIEENFEEEFQYEEEKEEIEDEN